MTIKQTMIAIAAAATMAAGMTAATTSSAQAGYGYKHHYGFKHHGFYKPHFYVPRVHCFYKPKKVWTYHGPVWVSKRVCY
jgi:hypothetical protein